MLELSYRVEEIAIDAKEEIRSKLNIEDVVGKYVQLKRAGRNFKGLSPFSQEKTPSFVVSPEKNIWHDFSSGRGGDVFSFIMELEGLDFKGAMEILGRQAGVDVSQMSSDSGLSKRKERIFEALDLATKYYQKSLVSNRPALEYILKKRKLSHEIVQTFRLGYAPNSDHAVSDFLIKRGFSNAELKDAGLVSERRGGVGDMFRGRIMIPLADGQGRIVGFTARLLDDNPKAPKYINTPQTLLYDKSRHVYGLHLAKEAIRRDEFVVVTEGNLDVISTHQFGFDNVVATAGTAVTENHLRALSRLTLDVRLCFDTDKAGLAATERAIGLANNLGINLGIINLPEDFKDPDEVVQKDVKLWKLAINSPIDAVQWLLDQYSKKFDLNTAEGKRRSTDRAIEVVSAIDDPVIKEHYLKKISERTGASLDALTKKLNKIPDERVRETLQTKQSNFKPLAINLHNQDHFLALLRAYPDLKDHINDLQPEDFSGNERRAIAASLKGAPKGLQSSDINVKINELSLIIDSKYPNLTEELFYDVAKMAKTIKLESKIRLREEKKRDFSVSPSETEREKLNQEINQIEKEIEALKR